MLDPVTVLSVAGNVCQFISYGLQATSKAREIHKSANGALKDNIEIEALTKDISCVAAKLNASASAITGNDSLDNICKQCMSAANDLLIVLNKLKVEGDKSKWKSARNGLKAVWGKKRVEEMKSRLQGWKNEIEFRVLVDLNIDISSIEQSERFDNLDENAKMILDALYGSRESIEDIILAESLRADERHEQTTTTIVAKQEETQVEITQSLESMDTNSRAEHEATRRELELMKDALAQIEQDMIRRDNELKELLSTLGNAHNKNERKSLQEKSNAVTVALFALVTVYQGLQRIVLALQNQAKLVLSAGISPLWDLKSYQPLPPVELEPVIPPYRSMFQGLLNKPASDEDDLEQNYLLEFDNSFKHFPVLKFQRRNFEWTAVETFDCAAIDGTVEYPDRAERLKFQIVALLLILDRANVPTNSADDLRHPSLDDIPVDSDWTIEFIHSHFCTYESIIILSTVLTEYLGSVSSAAQVLAAAWNVIPRRIRQGTISNMLAEHMEVWNIAGKIAGLQKEASWILRSRYQKWDVSLPKHGSTFQPNRYIERFLTWLMKESEPVFVFGIITPVPSDGARLYALIEFLIKVGFHLKITIGMRMAGQVSEQMQSSELQARVEVI